MGGQITNNTAEVLMVYGPPYNEYDNGIYWAKSGIISDKNVDVDGFYVPADRKIKQFSGIVVDGPVAVKFLNGIHFTVTQEGAIYIVDRPNFGLFKPSEYCRPSNYPKCVNWNIPNWTYPEVLNWCDCINKI
ncbi:hypothetical protein [Lysinibacillus fusiformis]|uniref:hypothetical protein n=1 Tax=Lysinibacillus fusiformis TaxID=28031 RepID=UPI0021C1C55C|nr:hypothetical protein [Lysinibacillus fusiformis]UXJ71391.1 hypothetical protein N5069_23500 [Lysinibacillus fusiformis]